jgi:hypothetical protein
MLWSPTGGALAVAVAVVTAAGEGHLEGQLPDAPGELELPGRDLDVQAGRGLTATV